MDYEGCILALIGWMRQYIYQLIQSSRVNVLENLLAYQSNDLKRVGVEMLKEEMLKNLKMELYSFTTYSSAEEKK